MGAVPIVRQPLPLSFTGGPGLVAKGLWLTLLNWRWCTPRLCCCITS